MVWVISVALWATLNFAISTESPAPMLVLSISWLACLVMLWRNPRFRALLLLSASAIGLSAYSFISQFEQKLKLVAFGAGNEGANQAGLLGGVKKAFSESLYAVSSDAGALVAGLAIGDDSRLSAQLAEQMKTVGLTHLTAVSGANCAIVIGLVYLLLKKLEIGRWPRTALALVALGAYVQLVGPQPSVLRAAFMAALVLVAIASGRKQASINALATAIMILLIADPWLAQNFGFALSVSATAGILILAPALFEKLRSRLPSWLALGFAVAISAQLACWPILLQLQNGISTYSLVANLAAEPLVAPVTILGILACVVAAFSPAVASLLTWVASCLTWLIAGLASWLSGLPAATLRWPNGVFGTVLACLILLCFVVWLKVSSRRIQTIGALGCILAVGFISGSSSSDLVRSDNWMAGDWSVVSCDVGQGDATVIRSAGKIALIDVGREPLPIQTCLRQLKITRIDLLVLTHFDVDHVGGLVGALDQRQVGTTIISDFSDDRPAAQESLNRLQQKNLQVIRAYRGVEGTLGAFNWRVLSPKPGAKEAEDSNDGSLSMLFSSPSLQVLTLADLGERGQKRLVADIGTRPSDSPPLVLKVAHHGSADQYPELHESLSPEVSLISVGAQNSYGHPTKRTLDLLASTGSTILRTDELGSISIAVDQQADNKPSMRIEVSR